MRYGLTIILSATFVLLRQYFDRPIARFSRTTRPTGGGEGHARTAVSAVGGGRGEHGGGKKAINVVVVCSPSTVFFTPGVRVVVRFRGQTKRPGKKRTAVTDRGKRRVHAAGSKLFPVRTAPPDGTTFAQVTVGDKAEGELPAFGYWNVQFYHPRAAYVRFDYEFPRGASIAVYGRRNALPTHTQYEILELLNGFESPRRARSTHVSRPIRLERMGGVGFRFSCVFRDDVGLTRGETRPLPRVSLRRCGCE